MYEQSSIKAALECTIRRPGKWRLLASVCGSAVSSFVQVLVGLKTPKPIPTWSDRYRSRNKPPSHEQNWWMLRKPVKSSQHGVQLSGTYGQLGSTNQISGIESHQIGSKCTSDDPAYRNPSDPLRAEETESRLDKTSFKLFKNHK